MQDRSLLMSGKIPVKRLFTIRQGEPAYDNVRGVIIPAQTDILKIKGIAGDTGMCRFFDPVRCACRIYAFRPAQCRVLTCWNTAAIRGMYDRDRLTRGHLLDRPAGLRDLVDEHQAKCDYRQVAYLAQRIRKGPDRLAAVDSLMAVIRYDHSLRQVTVERTRLDAELLDFLFGRPISTMMQMFHLRLAKVDGVVTINEAV